MSHVSTAPSVDDRSHDAPLAVEPTILTPDRLLLPPTTVNELQAVAPEGNLLALSVLLMADVRQRLIELERAVIGSQSPPASGLVVKESYTTAEVAERVGLSRWSIRQWCNKGDIKAVKVRGGGRQGEWRITHAELMRLQAERSAPLSHTAG